jgi:hypothetical protein
MLLAGIGGALETTASALASTVILLDRFPDARADLLNDPSLIPNAVEEMLRMESPFHAAGRTVRRDIEIDGHQFRVGDKVLLMYGAGSYDHEKFSEPEQFMLMKLAISCRSVAGLTMKPEVTPTSHISLSTFAKVTADMESPPKSVKWVWGAISPALVRDPDRVLIPG